MKNWRVTSSLTTFFFDFFHYVVCDLLKPTPTQHLFLSINKFCRWNFVKKHFRFISQVSFIKMLTLNWLSTPQMPTSNISDLIFFIVPTVPNRLGRVPWRMIKSVRLIEFGVIWLRNKLSHVQDIWLSAVKKWLAALYWKANLLFSVFVMH